MGSKVPSKLTDKIEYPSEHELWDLYHFMPKSCHIAQFVLRMAKAGQKLLVFPVTAGTAGALWATLPFKICRLFTAQWITGIMPEVSVRHVLELELDRWPRR
jgi:hypothetical protein